MADLAFRRGSGGSIIVNWHGDDVIKRAKSLEGAAPFAIGLEVAGVAKGICPVDTGRLRGSITVASSDGKATRPESPAATTDKIAAPSVPGETFVGTPVEYGPYQEYGTVKMYARPFLRPALDIVRGRVPAIVEIEARKEFGEYLNEKGKKPTIRGAFTE